ncbi:hypothetical protein [Arthrobacter sp. KK5.5]|uniref:hypothetical protein n=1 Tax=Arthrobacter sp. KK5.5 TaxID=3373084 RepID=UPI003EE781A8
MTPHSAAYSHSSQRRGRPGPRTRRGGAPRGIDVDLAYRTLDTQKYLYAEAWHFE